MVEKYFDNLGLPPGDLFTAIVENSSDFIYTKDLKFRYLTQADLIQEGNIGLKKAVKRFDPGSSVASARCSPAR